MTLIDEQSAALVAALVDNVRIDFIGNREVSRVMQDNGNIPDHITEDDLFYATSEYDYVKDAMQMEQDQAVCRKIANLGNHVTSSQDLYRVRRIANRMFDRSVARFKENPSADNYNFLDVAMQALQHAEKNLRVASTKD